MPDKLHRHTLANPVGMQHRHHRRPKAMKRLTMPGTPLPLATSRLQTDTMQPHQLSKLLAGVRMDPQPGQHPHSRITTLPLHPFVARTSPLIKPIQHRLLKPAARLSRSHTHHPAHPIKLIPAQITNIPQTLPESPQATPHRRRPLIRKFLHQHLHLLRRKRLMHHPLILAIWRHRNPVTRILRNQLRIQRPIKRRPQHIQPMLHRLTPHLTPPVSHPLFNISTRHQPCRRSRPASPQSTTELGICSPGISIRSHRKPTQLPLQHRIKQLAHRQIILALSLHLSGGRQLLRHQQRPTLSLRLRKAFPLELPTHQRHLSGLLHARTIRQRPLRPPVRTLSILEQGHPGNEYTISFHIY